MYFAERYGDGPKLFCTNIISENWWTCRKICMNTRKLLISKNVLCREVWKYCPNIAYDTKYLDAQVIKLCSKVRILIWTLENCWFQRRFCREVWRWHFISAPDGSRETDVFEKLRLLFYRRNIYFFVNWNLGFRNIFG